MEAPYNGLESRYTCLDILHGSHVLFCYDFNILRGDYLAQDTLFVYIISRVDAISNSLLNINAATKDIIHFDSFLFDNSRNYGTKCVNLEYYGARGDTKSGSFEIASQI